MRRSTSDHTNNTQPREGSTVGQRVTDCCATLWNDYTACEGNVFLTPQEHTALYSTELAIGYGKLLASSILPGGKCADAVLSGDIPALSGLSGHGPERVLRDVRFTLDRASPYVAIGNEVFERLNHNLHLGLPRLLSPGTPNRHRS